MRSVISVILILACAAHVVADNNESLEREVLHVDAEYFSAFNNADIAAIEKLMHPDLEFYHDIGGLTDYDSSIRGLRELLSRPDRPHRKLIEATTEVYPIKGFGALHVGEHQFCQIENGKPDCSVFKFSHLWTNEGGMWQLKRIISYGH